jgi:hypothetical protein
MTKTTKTIKKVQVNKLEKELEKENIEKKSNWFYRFFEKIIANQSSFLNTFIIYILVVFVFFINYLETKFTQINEITTINIISLQLLVIIIFISCYTNLAESLLKKFGLVFFCHIIIYIANLLLIFLTLRDLATNSYKIEEYFGFLVILSILLFVQTYIGNKKCIKIYAFLIFISLLAFLAFKTNEYLYQIIRTIDGKIYYDIKVFASISMLVMFLITVYQSIQLNLQDIYKLEKN